MPAFSFMGPSSMIVAAREARCWALGSLSLSPPSIRFSSFDSWNPFWKLCSLLTEFSCASFVYRVLENRKTCVNLFLCELFLICHQLLSCKSRRSALLVCSSCVESCMWQNRIYKTLCSFDLTLHMWQTSTEWTYRSWSMKRLKQCA